MAKIKLCKETGCHNAATTIGYCRLHYLKNWKIIKDEKQKNAAKRLNRYVEHIYKTHPENYLDIIKRDLRSSNFEKRYGAQFDEPEETDSLFENADYLAEIEGIIRELKIDKDF